jgi:signal transduction histidine kinase
MAVGGTTLFKLFLIVGIIIIAAVFVWYTLDVIAQLKLDAEKMVATYVNLWQLAASDNTSGGEVQIIFEEVIKKANFPVIIADLNDQPIFWRNVEGIADNDPLPESKKEVALLIDKIKSSRGAIPLKYGDKTINYFYYGDSPVIRQLQTMPFVEIGLVALFILVGFIGFQNIRRSEERKIWVGMAKETAHQLGTPISSLMGWLELLFNRCKTRTSDESLSELKDEEIFKQMQTDVARLQNVANRFGQIGSLPELRETKVNDILEKTASYYRKRLPFDGKGVRIDCRLTPLPNIPANGQLLCWAVENLIKNSLQAVDPQNGHIELTSGLAKESRAVVIQVIDNGPGIPQSYARKIFRPGFTSKKRGWGLGLTLAKRIVEEYHKGKIVLLKSRPGETIFQITLPIKKI